MRLQVKLTVDRARAARVGLTQRDIANDVPLSRSAPTRR